MPIVSKKEVTSFHKRSDRKFDDLLKDLIHWANVDGVGINRANLQRSLESEAEAPAKRGLHDWFLQTR